MDFGWPQVLTIVGANIILIMGMLGTYIALYLHTDKKIDAMREEAKEFNDKFYKETKDFHARLVAIEERNRPKII